MKNKYISTLLFLFIIYSQSAFTQEMPLDFTGNADNFIGFSGSGFAFNIDPEDGGNEVGQFFNDGSEIWGGFTLGLIRPIDLDFQKTISLSFYGFDPNVHNILIKLEEGDNPDVEVNLDVPAGGGWTHDLSFDFSSARLSANTSVVVNATGTYNRITIFIDGGVSTPGTYLIDNIDDGSEDTGGNPNQIDIEYTNLVWEDNFDIPGPVNALNWHHQTQVLFPGVGWANNEAQHYTDRIHNSFVDDSGFLNIVAIKEFFTDQGLTKAYTSARLNSKFAFTYGRVDVRAKIPIDSGTWPAIWMLGKNINENGGFWQPSFGSTGWPECGEIDIMEHGIFNSQNINYIGSALHTPCCFGGEPNNGGVIVPNLGDEFHVYSVNWSPNQITFLLDGEGFYTYRPAIKNADTWPFFEDQYLLLNIAMEGFAGPTDPSFSEASMLIDYVRVYQDGTVNTEEELDLEKAVQVYPNPAREVINISSDEIPSNAILYDVFGRLVSNLESVNRMDVSNLNPGVYFLELHFGKEKVSKRLVVE